MSGDTLRAKLIEVNADGLQLDDAEEIADAALAVFAEWLYERAREHERKCDDLHSGRVAPPIADTAENRAGHMWRYFDQAQILRSLADSISPKEQGRD